LCPTVKSKMLPYCFTGCRGLHKKRTFKCCFDGHKSKKIMTYEINNDVLCLNLSENCLAQQLQEFGWQKYVHSPVRIAIYLKFLSYWWSLCPPWIPWSFSTTSTSMNSLVIFHYKHLHEFPGHFPLPAPPWIPWSFSTTSTSMNSLVIFHYQHLHEFPGHFPLPAPPW